jgi:hypothetical protein
MGKQTLYHPVPLSVLRGALEFCGWSFASLKQVQPQKERGNIQYKVARLRPPKDAPCMDAIGVQGALQRCFMNNITVSRVQADSTGRIDAWIVVRMVEIVTEDDEMAAQRDIPF